MQKCLECGSLIRGRSDKKFCNDFCRNSYHNRKKSQSESPFKEINGILKRNYQILSEKVPKDSGKITLSREELLTAGFNFNYFTNIYTTKKENVYKYCYDYGYLLLDEEKVLLVKKDL